MPNNQQVIAVGDFNHDGNLDIVVASQDDNTVLVLLNNSGDGTFQDGYVKYGVGALPNAVAVGDFNGDGSLDIVTANQDGTVSVLLGNGDGTFQQPPQRSSVGTATVAVAVGDFNHDGVLDIVTATYSAEQLNSSVSVLLGNGDGTFQEPPLIYPAAPSGLPVEAVAVGDFNHDKNLDIVTAHSGLTVSVLLGNGDGTFQSYQDFKVAGLAPITIDVGDLDHDGNLDIVAAVQYADSNYVTVLLGNGDGTFQTHQDYSLAEYLTTVAVGDFTNDGNLDIVTANYVDADHGTVSVLLNNGDGTFQLPQTYYPVGTPPIAVAVGDFNGDGNLDIVTADVVTDTQEAIITIWYGNGDGTFRVNH